MRILLAGADTVLGLPLLRRLGSAHEILALGCDAQPELPVPGELLHAVSNEDLARFMAGCQAMIDLIGPDTDRLEPAARAAGIQHIIRVVPYSPLNTPCEGRCTLGLGQLIGPGDPQDVIRGWMRWAISDPAPGEGHAALVDHRDALGGIESALWKGKPGRVYPLVGANPSWQLLAQELRACWTKSSPPAPGAWSAPGPDVGRVDSRSSKTDLGWWHRAWGQSLSETVASL